jgi:hypothetical protein
LPLLVAAVLVLGIWIFVPAIFDPHCAALLMHSVSEVQISLPEQCTMATDVPADDMVRYLEAERVKGGLVFKAWVVCNVPAEAPKLQFAFEQDSHWLGSYVPGIDQFRRTAIVVPYARPIPSGSRIAAEVCLMPWRKYASQIAGQCHTKFAVWK